MPFCRSFNLYGLGLCVEAMTLEAAREVDLLFSSYAGEKKEDPKFFISIDADYWEGMEKDSGGLDLLWEGELPEGMLATHRGNETLRSIELHGFTHGLFDLASCRAKISYKRGAPWCLISGAVMPILAEFLRVHDHHYMHAAMLRVDGPGERAIILSGSGGAGKTTTALALARAGMKLVSDDISFVTGVAVDSGEPGLWGLLPRLKVCRPTLELLPWLAGLERPAREMAGEVLFPPSLMGEAGVLPPAKPQAIIFLGERSSNGHRLKPLDSIAALTLLLRENVSAVDRGGKGPSGKSFKAFANLVGSCRCFLLNASPGLETLPELLSGVLKG